jgi:LemA protein
MSNSENYVVLAGLFGDVAGFVGSIITWGIFLALALGAALFYSYNTLQRQGQLVKEALANIKVAIQKKAQLVNKLVETAEHIAGHEKVVQLKVSQDVKESLIGMADVYMQTNVALAQITGLAQKFPNLQGDRGYLQLMQDIKTIETEIQGKREAYNARCREYNAKRGSIPIVFFARAVNFSEAPYLDFDETNKDRIPEFTTDDGKLLEKLVTNVGQKVMEKSKAFGKQAGSMGAELVGRAKAVGQRPLYYYTDNDNNPVGPVSSEELNELLQKGVIKKESWVLEHGKQDWVKYDSLNVKSAFPPPPPPPSRE